VWQHVSGEVGYFMTALLQISRRMWQWKNFENRTVFDEVMCRLRWLTVFGPSCIEITTSVTNKPTNSCVTWYHLLAGASIPPTTMALPPKLTFTPPSLFRHPIPQTIFWTFYAQFCAILCVFSVNFGSWQSVIMTPQNNLTQSSECSERENFWENDRKTI